MGNSSTIPCVSTPANTLKRGPLKKKKTKKSTLTISDGSEFQIDKVNGSFEMVGSQQTIGSYLDSEFNHNKEQNQYSDDGESSSQPESLQSQFDPSAPVQFGRQNAMLELRIMSCIFQADYQKNTTQPKAQDRNLVYLLYVGDQVTKSWSAGDRSWQEDFVMVDDDSNPSKAKHKSSKKTSHLTTRQLKVLLPFECRFIGQQVMLEIRDESNFTIIYEGYVQFDQLYTGGTQLLDEYVSINMRELESSQNIQIQLQFKITACGGNQGKSFKSLEICEVQENTQQVACPFVFLQKALQKNVVEVLIPEFDSAKFFTRRFNFNFEGSGLCQLTGEEILKLSKGILSKPLTDQPTCDPPELLLTTEEVKSNKSTQSQSTSTSPTSVIKPPLKTEAHQVTYFSQPLSRRIVPTIVSSVQSGNLRIVPIIAIDFSLGNVLQNDDCLHNLQTADSTNDYLDIMHTIANSYTNVTTLPIFGFGAKTSTYSPKATFMFPLSRRIRNPFVPNDPDTIKQTYSECLNTIEMSEPCNLNPIINFLKQLGAHVKAYLSKRAKQIPTIKNSADSVYVLYVLSSGRIDDMQECLKTLSMPEWGTLPIQIQVIRLDSASDSDESLKKSQQMLVQEFSQLNRKSGWPQFLLQTFDRPPQVQVKKSFQEATNNSAQALTKLKQDTVFKVVRDFESYLFQSKIDMSKYKHNKNLTNANQSQQYVMDLIDKKFEKLKDNIYKLGIKPLQYREMVETMNLFEWSSEVALSLSIRFCSMVIAEEEEDADLDNDSVIGARRKDGRSSCSAGSDHGASDEESNPALMTQEQQIDHLLGPQQVGVEVQIEDVEQDDLRMLPNGSNRDDDDDF